MNTYPLATAPTAVNALVCARRRITLCGRTAAALSWRFAAELATEQDKITFLLGDNYFDPYAVARHAAAQGRDRRESLSSILVARGFTGYQFGKLIKRLDPDQISGPVMLGGFCSAFLDEDIPHTDAARLFYRALTNVARLAERGVAFLITQSQAILNARRQYFLRDLFRTSDYIFRLEQSGGYTLEARRHVPIGPPASRLRS
jgi:hypothetical protein